MINSRLFWRVFLTLAAFILVLAGLLVGSGLSSSAEVTRTVWWASVVLLLVALCGVQQILRGLVGHIRALRDAANAVALGQPMPLVDIDRNDELGELATAINAMNRALSEHIAELQARRQDLERSSHLWETVLTAMVEGVIVVNAQQRIMFANRASAQLVSFSSRDVVGRSLWEVARHPTLQQVLDALLIHGLSEKSVEFEIARTGSIVAMTGTRLPGDPCPGCVLVLHNVTELRRLERMRRDFVSNVSHELKTPLTAIQAYTETLLSGAIDDAEHNRSFLRQIEQQAERLHSQILDLLALARIESGAAFDLKPVDVRQTCHACLEAHRPVAESKSVHLDFEGATELIEVMADADELRTLLDNLVDNAIKYTPPGGRVAVRLTRDDTMARIDVSDSGIGIPREHLPRIFERFYRVDKARSRELGGTGLGLAIVKHLANMFGGNVSVRSEVGRGSTFTVTLPRRVAV